MTWLLDTNACIRYLNGRSPNLRAKLDAADPNEIRVCSVVKAEACNQSNSMRLANEAEVANTRAKLAELEARYEELLIETDGDEHVRQVTVRSLKRYINQFKEEIARYEAEHAVASRAQQ